MAGPVFAHTSYDRQALFQNEINIYRKIKRRLPDVASCVGGPIPSKILINMFYVYLLRSLHNPNITYIGYTADLKQRFADHNAGYSPHTSKYKPWDLHMYFAFSEKSKAFEFEKYLKSASGRAFVKNHF